MDSRIWFSLVLGITLLELVQSQPASPCQRERYEAVFSGGFMPVCSPTGYEPVQCQKELEECWCVVKETGEEIAHTRLKLPQTPNCDSVYPALGVSSIDILEAVSKNRGDDIVWTLDTFRDLPSYEFQSSYDIYALSRDYFPPGLWPDFSILVTIKPMTWEGGFLFAITDYLESVIQFGVGLSPGENTYTQSIDLWYSEDHLERGSTKIAQFTVPTMVGRWSRFAIGVNSTSISLHVYCQKDYAVEQYKRTYKRLQIVEDGYLLVGHGGDIFAEPFQGFIQELVITNDPEDAERQCEDNINPGSAEYRKPISVGSDGDLDDNEPGEDPIDPGSGDIPDVGNEGFDPDELFSTEPQHTTTPPTDIPRRIPSRAPAPGGAEEIGTTPRDIIGMPGEKGDRGEKGDLGHIGPVGLGTPETGDIHLEGIKGDKGDPGVQGAPGQHGINGIPGLEGAIGSTGMPGSKGEKGENGVGETGLKGAPGASVKGEPGDPGVQGSKGEPGLSVIGPRGKPGRSFFEELEEKMTLEGSGEGSGEGGIEDLFTEVPALELLRGLKGEPGNCTMVTGPSGRAGADGRDGQPGLPGVRGPRGDEGEPGMHGSNGTKGEAGLKGDLGPSGAKGEKGGHGERGPQGLQGPPGPSTIVRDDGAMSSGQAGDPGQPGEDGLSGAPGEKGEQGEQGVRGDQGEQGADGMEGQRGPSGSDGLDGEPGLPGAPGKQGTPGTDGVDGEKGDTGIGLPGAPGPPGPPGISSGKPFFGGEDTQMGMKGDKGEAGEPGNLDLNDFIDILPRFSQKGDKGDIGVKGDDGGCKMCVGFKGSRGRRGQRGTKGPHGVLGPKGEIGVPGFPGRNGIPGAPGTPGDSIKGEMGEPGMCECEGSGKAVKGEKGEPGVVTKSDGVTIIQGPPGPPGPPGETVVGLQGPPGPRGLPGGNSLGNIVMFASQAVMASSSLAIPSGTLGFVTDEQRLYLRVNLGWQAISMGIIIPMDDGKYSNSLPSFLRETSMFSDNMKDAAAASGGHDVLGVLRIFALNAPLSASDIVGVSGADYYCYQQARQAKVSGTFRAVLTSRLQSIDSLVFSRDQDLSIVNARGEKVLESWSGVTKNKGYWVEGVPIYTFNGDNISTDSRWSSKYFWHGATSAGKADTSSYCRAWTSPESADLGISSSFLSGQVLDKSLHTCDTKLAVLCIETTLPEIYRLR